MDDPGRAWPPADATDGDYRRASLVGTRLEAVMPVAGGPGRAVALAMGPADDVGLAPWTVVPVVAHGTDGAAGVAWRRARPGDGVAAGLVASMVATSAAAEAGVDVEAVGGFRLEVIDPGLLADVDPDERPVGVDQTNESVVVGERLAVKWLLHPDPARERAPHLLRHLAAAGFRELPPLAGTLSWLGGGMNAPMTLAIVDGWLPGARDGWEWCTEAVTAHVAPDHRCDPACPARFASDVGGLVARLHLALAAPTGVIPDPVGTAGRDRIDGWERTARGTLREAIALTAADDPAAGAELERLSPALDDGIRSLGSVAAAIVQPIHGDLHVGQVLQGPHGLAVIDLDGNPTADADTLQAPAPAARDVAAMACSLDHVGRIAVRRGASEPGVAAWIDEAWAAFLASYRAALATAGQGRLFDPRLIRPFRVEQECRELIYAARFLPRWRYAPMGAIRAMVASR